MVYVVAACAIAAAHAFACANADANADVFQTWKQGTAAEYPMGGQKMMVRIKPAFARLIAWSYPDMPQRPLCALCHGTLSDEIPLLAWRADGSCIALCDQCVEEVLEVIP